MARVSYNLFWPLLILLSPSVSVPGCSWFFSDAFVIITNTTASNTPEVEDVKQVTNVSYLSGHVVTSEPELFMNNLPDFNYSVDITTDFPQQPNSYHTSNNEAVPSNSLQPEINKPNYGNSTMNFLDPRQEPISPDTANDELISSRFIQPVDNTPSSRNSTMNNVYLDQKAKYSTDTIVFDTISSILIQQETNESNKKHSSVILKGLVNTSSHIRVNIEISTHSVQLMATNELSHKDPTVLPKYFDENVTNSDDLVFSTEFNRQKTSTINLNNTMDTLSDFDQLKKSSNDLINSTRISQSVDQEIVNNGSVYLYTNADKDADINSDLNYSEVNFPNHEYQIDSSPSNISDRVIHAQVTDAKMVTVTESGESVGITAVFSLEAIDASEHSASVVVPTESTQEVVHSSDPLDSESHAIEYPQEVTNTSDSYGFEIISTVTPQQLVNPSYPSATELIPTPYDLLSINVSDSIVSETISTVTSSDTSALLIVDGRSDSQINIKANFIIPTITKTGSVDVVLNSSDSSAPILVSTESIPVYVDFEDFNESSSMTTNILQPIDNRSEPDSDEPVEVSEDDIAKAMLSFNSRFGGLARAAIVAPRRRRNKNKNERFVAGRLRVRA